jgi:vacuolar-type H+-ATPase subunit F/Vma7
MGSPTEGPPEALVGTERGAVARHQEDMSFISFERQQLGRGVVVILISEHLVDPVRDHVRLR